MTSQSDRRRGAGGRAAGRASRRRLSGGNCSRWPRICASCRSRRSCCRTPSSTLTEAVKAVNTRIDEQAGARARASPTPSSRPTPSASDLRVVRERVDDTNVRITSLSQEVEALREADLRRCRSDAAPTDPAAAGPPARRAMLPTSARAGAGARTTRAPSASRRRRAPAPTAGSPSRLYDMAWADYTAGSYDLGDRGLHQLLAIVPEERVRRQRAVLHRRELPPARPAGRGGRGVRPA